MTKKEKLALAKSKEKEVKPVAPVDEEIVEGEPEDTTKGEPLPQNDEVKPVAEPVKSGSGSTVIFRLKNGQIREFSKELHGEDYKKVAEAFKNNGKNLVAKEL